MVFLQVEEARQLANSKRNSIGYCYTLFNAWILRLK